MDSWVPLDQIAEIVNIIIGLQYLVKSTLLGLRPLEAQATLKKKMASEQNSLNRKVYR